MTFPVMIFAAGKGTRMAPLTDTTPKPLIKVGGRTLLDRALDLTANCGHRVINTHYLGQQIQDHIRGLDIQVSDESELLLETGGGLRRALPLLGPGPVVTINPDAVWTDTNPIDALMDAWDDRMDALLMLVPLDRCHGRQGGGDFHIDIHGHLLRKGDLVYGGAQIISTDRLQDIPEDVFSLNRLWDMILAEGRAYGLIHDGEWCDVGRPDCIPIAEDLLRGGDCP